MAYSEEADEDFKLPLRPWLEKQINSRKFKGLEWELTGGDDKQFRLPWVKKNLPDWEQYYMIFRAWAEHRGRGVNSLDDSKAKSNFRCALNKSVDFEEITSKSKLQLQTGNYKVYRILSPREVREKKNKRSRIQTKEESEGTGSSSFDNNFDSADFKTVNKKDLDFLDSIGSSMEVTSMDVDTSIPGEFVSETMHTIAPDMISMDTPFILDADLACAQMVLHPPDSDDLGSMLAISPLDNSQANQMQRVEPQRHHTSVAPPSNLSMSSIGHSSNVEAILTQLENADLRREKLRECDLVIRYDGHVVYNETLPRMDLGYRIFYGNPEEQIRLLRMRNATDEKLADFGLTGIQLPRRSHMSPQVSAILDKTELGMIIRYDPATLHLSAKRLCQSQIFFFDPLERGPSAGPVKLEREEIVTIFSHEKYVLDLLEQYMSGSLSHPHQESAIHLAVGIKPKTLQGMRHMKGLKIELIPHILKFFSRTRDPHASLSLCFSNPSSIEQFLRQVNRNSVAAN